MALSPAPYAKAALRDLRKHSPSNARVFGASPNPFTLHAPGSPTRYASKFALRRTTLQNRCGARPHSCSHSHPPTDTQQAVSTLRNQSLLRRVGGSKTQFVTHSSNRHTTLGPNATADHTLGRGMPCAVIREPLRAAPRLRRSPPHDRRPLA